MAVAIGVWGKLSEFCEDNWNDDVKEDLSVWESCDNVEGSEMLSTRECKEVRSIENQAISEAKRTKFISKCAHHVDFNHFYQGVPGSRAKRSQLRHHHVFDVDHKGVDFSGFIIHDANKHDDGHRFKVFLDSNNDGGFDKEDELIGKSSLRNMHSRKGVANLLAAGEIGHIEVEFKRRSSIRADETSVERVGRAVTAPVTGVCVYSIDILDPDGRQVAQIVPDK